VIKSKRSNIKRDRIVMNLIICSTLICGFIGYIVFIMFIVSKKMAYLPYRNGNYLSSDIIRFMKSPLVAWYLWHPTLLRANWIFTTFTGMLIGYVIGFALDYLFLCMILKF